MTVKFHKYQGTGNDFIIIDNRIPGLTKSDTELVRSLCDRRFGIGADGLILLENKASFDFEMVYFNSDGNESSMCGNGGRCLIQFANDLGLISSSCKFVAIDGAHSGEILKDGRVSLKMKEVATIEEYNADFILNTGSPHYIRFTKDVRSINVLDEARKIRYSDRFRVEGINVNFVEQKSKDQIFVRTYERGVEGETLSCGTGVVAAALVWASKTKTVENKVGIETPGGNLEAKYQKNGDGFKEIYLIGPAVKVYDGTVEV